MRLGTQRRSELGGVIESLEQRALFSVDPAITSVLPSAELIATVKNTTTVTVDLTNHGNVPVKGDYTVQFYASADQTLDASDTLISTTPKVLATLKAGLSRAVKFKLGTVPTVAADGAYYILADVTGAVNGGVDSVAASAGTVVIADPFVDLSDTAAILSPLASKTVLPGKSITLEVVVTNHGNVAAAGSLPIDIASSTNATGTPSTEEGIVAKTINIKPGKSTTIKLSHAVPAATALGSYYYVATLDASTKFMDSDLSNNTAVTPTTATVADKYPDILGTFSGATTVATGVDAGQTGTLTLDVTTESQTNGVSSANGILTNADGTQSDLLVTFTVSTKGVLLGHSFNKAIELTDAFNAQIVGDALSGTILSSNGADQTLSFSLTPVS